MVKALTDLDGKILRFADGSIIPDSVYDQDFPDPDAVSAKRLAELMALVSGDVKKYDKNQPRDPKGTPTGGQFSSPDAGVLPRGVRFPPDPELKDVPHDQLMSTLDIFPETSIEQFVKREGEEFVVPDSPPDIEILEPNLCFANCGRKVALTFDEDRGKYDYVEGFVIDIKLPFPIHHAWLAEHRSNKVIDSTLGWLPNATYRGIRMSEPYIREKMSETGYFGVLSLGDRASSVVRGEDKDFDYKDKEFYDRFK